MYIYNIYISYNIKGIYISYNIYIYSISYHEIKNMSLQIIEQFYSNATDIEDILWHRKKYWQSQLFTTTHGMNSLIDLYCPKRKAYRKDGFAANYF